MRRIRRVARSNPVAVPQPTSLKDLVVERGRVETGTWWTWDRWWNWSRDGSCTPDVASIEPFIGPFIEPFTAPFTTDRFTTHRFTADRFTTDRFTTDRFTAERFTGHQHSAGGR